jgi:N-acetylglutamate synthase-like GNAT family acetyltransferase
VVKEPRASFEFSIRPAIDADLPAIAELIPRSARSLQAPYYSPAQIEAALGPVFAVDSQLIADGTYYIVEHADNVVGCGGWSRRLAVFGGDTASAGARVELDPQHDPARIRAFFVDPAWARRGVGRLLLATCEAALQAAGFQKAVLVATLAGEPLYLAAGYSVVERYNVPLGMGETLPVTRMAKSFGIAPTGSGEICYR